MTEVDFYLLPVPEMHGQLMFACRLAEKAWRQGHNVFLQAPDTTTAQQLDDLLWSFQDASFVPHGLLGTEPKSPVEIGSGDEAGDHHDVLINLSGQIPAFFSRFERVAEIVLNDEQQKQQSREAWKYYKDRGYPFRLHDIANIGGQR